MDTHRVGSLVIVDSQDGRPIGIFTLQDVLRRVALPAVGLGAPVETVMTRQIETLHEGATVYEGLLLMSHHRIRHLPVLGDNGALSGVVSLKRGDTLPVSIR